MVGPPRATSHLRPASQTAPSGASPGHFRADPGARFRGQATRAPVPAPVCPRKLVSLVRRGRRDFRVLGHRADPVHGLDVGRSLDTSPCLTASEPAQAWLHSLRTSKSETQDQRASPDVSRGRPWPVRSTDEHDDLSLRPSIHFGHWAYAGLRGPDLAPDASTPRRCHWASAAAVSAPLAAAWTHAIPASLVKYPGSADVIAALPLQHQPSARTPP